MNKKNIWIFGVVALFIIGVTAGIIFGINQNKTKTEKENKPAKYNSPYKMHGNSLENFDLYFLKLENEQTNKVYSPLSIKYALQMLSEGAKGNTKEEIDAIIGDYESKKYTNSENMSIANALFVRSSFKENIKKEYQDLLVNKYDAEVIFDDFTTPDNINNWIKNKTLNLIDKMVDSVSDKDFLLVNALGIDMEWKENFLEKVNLKGPIGIGYSYEYGEDCEYCTNSSPSTNLGMRRPIQLSQKKFNGENIVMGMNIDASYNRYDIVNTLGEDNIRKTVEEAYRKFLADPMNKQDADYVLNGDYSEENISKYLKKYIDDYIKNLNNNYNRGDRSTEFSFLVNDEVKAFAKDLKQYNGVTLQYVAFMPQTTTLDDYINNIDASKLNNIITNLKDVQLENFKEGVVTEIDGFIPRFEFEYDLNLLEDLKKLGVNQVFSMENSNLTNISNHKPFYISDVRHKSNISFTEDGIKAAAVTTIGGGGAGFTGFYYAFPVPVERIDLTFDKPYMFIIRDKDTGEIWFTGTVYEPLACVNNCHVW